MYDFKTPEYEQYVKTVTAINNGEAPLDDLNPALITARVAAAAYQQLPEYTVTETTYYRVRATDAAEATATYRLTGRVVDHDLPQAVVED
jgi:hypothetical protein